jgi:Ca-activated chloride channel family protein
MNIKNTSIAKTLKQNRLGLTVYAGLLLITLALLLVSKGALSLSRIAPGWNPSSPVQLSGKLSQTKLIQGGQQTVYLDVGIKTPAQEMAFAPQRATDMVIVLDRSGAMSAARKMNYAKTAIRDVLARLNPGDRFALISFSDHSIVHSPLVNIGVNNRNQLNNLVNNIVSGGGTNMADGLNAALHMLNNNYSLRISSEYPGQRARKVLLLSDGHATQGITDPNQLAAIAGRISETGTVVSTIGMGLDFNEMLMSKLADHGMGRYAYLEDLSGLATILANDLQNTRNTYANSSHLEITLGDGVQVIDAGGYPISHLSANTISIATGQLLANANKNFVISFRVPTQTLGDLALGRVQLVYQNQGTKFQTRLDDTHLQLAILEPARKEEVVHSIDHDVYKQSWLKNNLGLLQKKTSALIRSGEKHKAEQAITDYRQKLRQVEAESNVPMASAAMDDKLEKMKADVNEAFVGSRADQEVKRKRAAKSMQYGAIKEQRAIK